MSTALAPVAGLDELDRHLDALLSSSTLTVDTALVDDVALQLSPAHLPSVTPQLLPKLVAVLEQNQIDVSSVPPLAALATKLVDPLTLDDALSLAPAARLALALHPTAAAPATQLLALTVVHKAKSCPRRLASPSENNDNDNLAQLADAAVVCWLASPDVGVGEKAGRVLGDLLEADVPLSSLVNGANGSNTSSGALWTSFLSGPLDRQLRTLCRPTASSPLDPRQQSLAQGRVLRLLLRLAVLRLDLVSSDDPSDNHPSLLRFAGDMVDRSDVLMHLSLVDFYERLVSVLRVSASSSSSSDPQRVIDVLRPLLAQATADDPELLAALQSLPQRTVPEEADELQAWLRQVLPGTRIPLR